MTALVNIVVRCRLDVWLFDLGCDRSKTFYAALCYAIRSNLYDINPVSINFRQHAQKAFQPLLENKNALVKFPIETGIEVDPETGNNISVNTFVTFEVILHTAKDTESDSFFPGVDEVGMKLVGRIVNPKTFPPGICDRTKGTVEFIDGRKGVVTLYLPPVPAYVGSELGTRVGLLFQERAIA